jgi:branched-chain amino acid transport system substrate-binding protein
MSSNSTTMMAVLLIVGLAVGAGAGYLLTPTKTVTETVTVVKSPLEDKTIQIGAIIGATYKMEVELPMFEQIIVPDAKAYLEALGYDNDFEILVDDAQGEPANHVEKIQAFHAIGMDIIIGSGWSSQLQASLPYANENNMIMVSASSTSPLLAIPNDRLFRLSVTDVSNAIAIPEMIWGFGVEHIVLIHSADAYGDGAANILSAELPKKGISILEKFRMPVETIEFSTYLDQMNNVVGEAIDEYGAERVGVLTALAFELITMYNQAVDYTHLNEVTWFGPEATGRNQRIVDDVGWPAVNFRGYSMAMQPAATRLLSYYNDRFFAVNGLVPEHSHINKYDITQIYIKSILETASLDAADITNAFPKIANNHMGISGWCELNEVGDRVPGIFYIWGYADLDGEVGFLNYGTYNFKENVLSWNTENLEDQGIELIGH